MKVDLQIDEKDCGLIVLMWFFKKFYNKKININILKSHANYSKNGISIFDLNNLAEKIGLRLEPLEGDFKSFQLFDIKSEIITLVKDENYFHYIVIEGKDSEYIYIFNPSKGKQKIKINEFKNMYLNIIIEVNKTNKFNLEYTTEKSKLDFISSNIWEIILILSISVLGQSLTFGSSYFIKYVIDAISTKNKDILNIFIIFSWVFLVRTINNYFNNFLKNKLTKKIEIKIFNLFFKKTINGKLKHLQKINKSDYIQRLNSIPEVSNFFSNVINIIFINSISFIVVNICLGIINWKLYLIIIFTSIFKFFILIYFKKSLHKNIPKIINNNIKINNKNFELFLNDVYSKNTYYQELNQNAIEKLLEEQKQINTFILNNFNLRQLLTQFLNIIEQTTIMYIGATFIKNNNFTLGNLLFFNSILIYMNSPVESLIDFTINWKINKQNITRLEYILYIDEEKIKHENLQIISDFEINSLSFEYDGKLIFNNLSLKIDKNTIITGKNGIGKSTFLKLLYGLYDDYKGSIKINNVDLKLLNIKDIREKIFLNSNNIYFPNLEIVEFITLKNEKALNILKHNIEKYNLQDLISYFNLSFQTKLEDGGMKLSSGQRQLIFILQLFCFKFDFVFLDEAFENINEKIFVKLQRAIIDFQENAIFVEISHSKKYITEGKIVNF